MWNGGVARLRHTLWIGFPAFRLPVLAPPGRRIWVTAAILLLILAAPYFSRVEQSRPVERVRSSTPAISEETGPVSASQTDAGPACRAVRKRLWLEDEGWIVRTVQICK
jgi:hypothetical protein